MRIIRLSSVMEKVGLSRSSIYQKISAGTFPRPVPLGGRAVGWLSDEIEAWILERVEERDGLAQRSCDD